MRRIHLLLLFLVLSTVSCCIYEQSKSWTRAAFSTLKLVSSDGYSGSGVAVSSTPNPDGSSTVLILTCYHVIAGDELDMSRWTVNIANDRWIGTPTYVASDWTNDVALLQVITWEQVHVTQLRVSHPPVGEESWVVGYPNGGNRVITHGYIGDYGQTSAASFPGNSGGPVLDAEGRLVGLVKAVGCAQWRNRENVLMTQYVVHDTYFIPLAKFRDWLEAYL